MEEKNGKEIRIFWELHYWNIYFLVDENRYEDWTLYKAYDDSSGKEGIVFHSSGLTDLKTVWKCGNMGTEPAPTIDYM